MNRYHRALAVIGTMSTVGEALRRCSVAMAIEAGPRGMAVWLVAALVALVSPVPVPGASAQAPSAPPAGALHLHDLERMALDGNPTMAQARASVRAAEGRTWQAALYPNPLIGYEAEDLNAREPAQFKNFFWFQVPIVTAGKLGLSRGLAHVDRQVAGITADVQRLRVLTTVRMLYYGALGAARTVELRRELVQLVRAAVETSEELFNIGQADRPDVLDVEIELQRTELELARALSQQERIWRSLAAAVGNPSLPLTALGGDLEGSVPALDREAVVAMVLGESPEVRIARANVERARAARERVRAERFPNMFLRAKLGHNSERFEPSGGPVGFEAGVEIGVALPIFDRQQGNLVSAEADLEHAEKEVQRLELVLRTELASAMRSYEDALAEVERYRQEIIPRAQQSFELYQRGFQQMAAAYPQVLIARRTLFRARTDYVQALVELRQAVSLLEGMLLAGGLETPSHTSVQAPPPTGHIPSPAGRPAD